MQTTSATAARYVGRESLAPWMGGKLYSPFHQRRLEAAGKFPKRKYLTPQRPVWDVEELDRWMADRVAAGSAT